jgi:hypothetical protein
MHRQVLRLGRRILIAVAGGIVIVAGVVLAMPLVPGPGIALVLLGLGILSLEFQWPRIWLAAIKAKGIKLKQLWLVAISKIKGVQPKQLWLAAKAKGVQLKQRFTRRRPQPDDGQ